VKRVVITGMGIVSCLGNNQEEVYQSLINGKSGITYAEEYKEYNLKSQIHGKPNIKLEDFIDRKTIRFMGSGSAYNYIAMHEAIKDSGLEEKDVSNFTTGIIMGSGGPSIKNVVLSVDKTRAKTPKLMGPFIVPRTMGSTASATLAVPFKIKGVNYTISSACATSGHSIGNAMELIQYGKQNIVFAGGSEELHWAMTAMFDAMTALSSKYNDTPEQASRAYDKTRDGFVIAGGGGVLVLEELEHAKARGAKIYAELTGYGATSDGYDMVAPSGEGAVRCMQMALSTKRNKKIDYINTHGTSTPVGDITELRAVGEVFKDEIPKISSTKSLSGHPLGAASVHEAIYCLIMMKNKFIAASANITEMDDEAKKFPIVTQVQKNIELNCVMSNSFGFGGTNAALVFEKREL
jgi:3-oxoacyl-[acyl-carrier-protein] synthase I